MTLAKSTILLSVTLIAAFFAIPAAADTVTIQSNDGKVSVVGQVVAVQDRNMTIQTLVGPLTFNLDAVSCEGIGCPSLPLDNVQPTGGKR